MAKFSFVKIEGRIMVFLIKTIFYFFFGEVTNILNNNPPIIPPYKVLFKGFEVMAQVPEAQPTK